MQLREGLSNLLQQTNFIEWGQAQQVCKLAKMLTRPDANNCSQPCLVRAPLSTWWWPHKTTIKMVNNLTKIMDSKQGKQSVWGQSLQSSKWKTSINSTWISLGNMQTCLMLLTNTGELRMCTTDCWWTMQARKLCNWDPYRQATSATQRERLRVKSSYLEASLKSK